MNSFTLNAPITHVSTAILLLETLIALVDVFRQGLGIHCQDVAMHRVHYLIVFVILNTTEKTLEYTINNINEC